MTDRQIIAESGRFKMEVELLNPNIRIRPVGALNEDVDIGAVVDFIRDHRTDSSQLIIDMGYLQAMNSCGIREWVLFMEKVQGLMPCSFSLANEVFIEQASIVPNLIGAKGTKVEMFAAPYFCPKCEKRYSQQLKASEIKEESGTFQTPKFKCKTCSNPLEFDALEDEYFHFLKHSRNAG